MALNIVTASGSGSQRGTQIGEQLADLLSVAWNRWVIHFSKNDVDDGGKLRGTNSDRRPRSVTI